jgi:hypothetical protein
MHMMYYTLCREGSFFLGQNRHGEKSAYVWEDAAVAGAFCERFSGCEVLALSPEEMLTAIKDQQKKGLAYVVMKLTGAVDFSIFPVDLWITITTKVVEGRAQLLDTMVADTTARIANAVGTRSVSITNPAFRVNPAHFLLGIPSANEIRVMLESNIDHPTDPSVMARVRLAKIMAEDLGTPISDTEAISIAKNRHASSTINSDPVPLTPRERAIAEEIQFHAWTAEAYANGTAGFDARGMAKHMVAVGERGTRRSTGCLPVILALGIGLGFCIACVL